VRGENPSAFCGCGLSSALDSELRSLNLELSHISARRWPPLEPEVNQRSANVAGTAIKAMPTRAETADANV